MKTHRSISYTISTDEDWDLLRLVIEREVTWPIGITQCLVEYVEKMDRTYGVYMISYGGELYLTVTVKSGDPDLMVCDYPVHEIDVEKRWHVYVKAAAVVCVIAVCAGACWWTYNRFG